MLKHAHLRIGLTHEGRQILGQLHILLAPPSGWAIPAVSVIESVIALRMPARSARLVSKLLAHGCTVQRMAIPETTSAAPAHQTRNAALSSMALKLVK